jgi:hypothetical protein
LKICDTAECNSALRFRTSIISVILGISSA